MAQRPVYQQLESFTHGNAHRKTHQEAYRTGWDEQERICPPHQLHPTERLQHFQAQIDGHRFAERYIACAGLRFFPALHGLAEAIQRRDSNLSYRIRITRRHRQDEERGRDASSGKQIPEGDQRSFARFVIRQETWFAVASGGGCYRIFRGLPGPEKKGTKEEVLDHLNRIQLVKAEPDQ